MKTQPKTKAHNTIKLHISNNEQLVQAVLSWDEDHYCNFKFEAGLAYAKRMTDNDAVGFDFLVATAFYWNWWKNEWSKRDDDFLLYYSSTANKAMLHDSYLFQHNIQRLKSDKLMEKKAVSMVEYCFNEFNKKRQKEAAI